MLAAFLRDEFRRHGLLVNWSKSDDTGSRQARVLGIDIDLDKWTYSVPQDKKTKICDGLETLIADAEAGRQISVRACAQSIGRVMATGPAVGAEYRRVTWPKQPQQQRVKRPATEGAGSINPLIAAAGEAGSGSSS